MPLGAVGWGVVAAGALSAGASVYGASQQAGAAQNAAQAQEQAAMAQYGLDANVFNAQAGMEAPTRALGGLAQQELAYMEGLSPDLNISSDFQTPQITVNPQTGQSSLSWQANGTAPGAPTQAGAYTVAPGSSSGINGIPGLTAQVPSMGGSGIPIATGSAGGAPAAGATGTAANMYNGAGPTAPGGYGSLMNPYNPSTFYQDPGYQFIQQQGDLALGRQAAAGGQMAPSGSYTGAQAQALDQYTTGLASQEFNNAFNRSMATQSAQFNMLSALSGGGQVATQQVGGAAGQLGTAGSSALAGYGNASAAGSIGAANAMTSGLNSVGSTATGVAGTMYNAYMNPLNPSSPNYYNPAALVNPATTSNPYVSAGGGYQYNNPAYIPPVTD